MEVIKPTGVGGFYIQSPDMPGPELPVIPDQQILTASRIASYNSCRKRERIRYTLGYAEAKESSALSFGKAMHAFLEQWWALPSGDRSLAFTALPLWRDKLAVDDFADLDILTHGYHEYWSAEQDQIETVAVEAEFRAPILHPEDLGTSEQRLHVDFQLGGKIDAIAGIKDGTIIEGTPVIVASPHTVVEHKTTSETIETDAEKYWDKLLGDPQLSNYMVGADQLGYQCAQALYDVIRKPQLRQKKNESTEEFIERIRTDVAERPRYYFRRRLIPRMHTEVINFMGDAWDIASELQLAAGIGIASRNTKSCFEWGRKCEYYEHCYFAVPLSEIDTLVKKAPFEELTMDNEQKEGVQ